WLDARRARGAKHRSLPQWRRATKPLQMLSNAACNLDRSSMNYLPMKRVLVTGATGFVGGALVRRLGVEPGMVPVAGVRRVPVPAETSVEYLALGDLEDCRVSPQDLQGFSAVVHAAARVHVMHDHAADPLAEFRRINVQGTLALATAAAAA